MWKYEKLVLGELSTNCYLLWETTSGEGVVIDPADDGVGISQEIAQRQINLVGVLATHGHFDHLLGGLELKLIYKVPFYAHSEDEFLINRQKQTAEHFLGRKVQTPNFKKIDVDLADLKQIKIGNDNLEVLLTPGHTPGGVSFYLKSQGWLFVGDLMFKEGLKGDTSHKYSDNQELSESIMRVLSLPGEVIILPGHGEETNVENEKVFYEL